LAITAQHSSPLAGLDPVLSDLLSFCAAVFISNREETPSCRRLSSARVESRPVESRRSPRTTSVTSVPVIHYDCELIGPVTVAVAHNEVAALL
jgi:hypothetical protein